MKIIELAKQLKINEEHILDIIRQAGIPAESLEDEVSNENMALLVSRVDEFIAALKDAEKKPEPALSVPQAAEPAVVAEAAAIVASPAPAADAQKKINPSLNDLSQGLNIELNALIEQAAKLGINIEDPAKELNAGDGEKILNNLNVIKSGIEGKKSAPAPVTLPPAPAADAPAAQPAAAVSRPGIPAFLSGIASALVNPYFIIGTVFASLTIIIPVGMAVRSERLNRAAAVVQPPAPQEKELLGTIWQMCEGGFYRSAYELAQDFTRSFPRSMLREDVAYKMAEILFLWKREPQSIQYKSAIKQAHEALNAYPHSPKASWAWVLIGDSYAALNLRRKAISYYKAAVKKYPWSEQSDRVQYAIAEQFFLLKEWEQALRQYKYVVAACPGTSWQHDAAYRIAETYRGWGKTEDAARSFQEYLSVYEHGGKRADALFSLGEMMFALHKYDKAEEYFRKTIAPYPHDSRNASAYLKIAECRLAAKDHGKAIAALQEVCYVYPRSPLAEQARFLIPEYYRRKGDRQKAIEEYLDVLKRYPASVHIRSASISLGVLYLAGGQLDKALETLGGVIVKYPLAQENDQAMLYLVRAYYKKKMYAAAAATLEQLIVKYPLSPKINYAYFLRADAYRRAGLYAEAKKAYMQKLSRNPSGRDSELCFYYLGECSYMLKQYDDAVKFLNEDIDRYLFGRYRYWARFLLAKVYVAKGEKATAIRHLEKLTGNDYLQGTEVYLKACLYLAPLYQEAGRSSEALKLCAELMAGGPESARYREGLFLKVRLLSAQSKRKAEDVLRQAVSSLTAAYRSGSMGPELTQTLAECQISLGDMLFNGKRTKDALEYYLKAEKLLQDGMQKSWVLYQIGKAYRLMGDTAQAETAVKKLKGAYPESYWSREFDRGVPLFDWQYKQVMGVQR